MTSQRFNATSVNAATSSECTDQHSPHPLNDIRPAAPTHHRRPVHHRWCGAPAARFVMVVLTASLLGGCATTVEGAPVSAGGPPRAVDVRSLDVGGYPTQPRSPLGTAGTAAAGAVIETQRMANYVVGPWEVAAELNSTYAMGAAAMTDSNALAMLGPNRLAAVSGRHNFINGFVTARQATGQTSLINAVLRFADPPSAAAALTELEQTTVSDSGPTPEQRTAIADQFDALATSSSVTDPTTQRQWSVVRSFTAHGQYLLTEVAASVHGLIPAARLIANTIDLQRRVIDQYQPTEPAAFADLPVDPTGLLARTLPLSPQQANATQNARFGKRGALHFHEDPNLFNALFDTTAMDLATRAKTNVYRSSDANAAALIADKFAAQAEMTGALPADGVPGMSASRCVRLRVGYYCVASADRFALEAYSLDLRDAHQQIAAQYTLLVY
jgi:hypothetical protein